MIARVVLWSLADADATFGELRDALDDEPADVPGRLFEAWISDESSDRWGMLSVFATREAADRAPAGRIGALIGKAPELFEEFDVVTTRSATS